MRQGISGESSVQEWLTSVREDEDEKEDGEFCGRCPRGAKGGCWFEYPVQGSGALSCMCRSVPHHSCSCVGRRGGRDRFVSGNATASGCSSILPLATDLDGSACPLLAPGWNNTLAPASANVPEVIKHYLHPEEQYPIPSDLDARKT